MKKKIKYIFQISKAILRRKNPYGWFLIILDKKEDEKNYIISWEHFYKKIVSKIQDLLLKENLKESLNENTDIEKTKDNLARN